MVPAGCRRGFSSWSVLSKVGHRLGLAACWYFEKPINCEHCGCKVEIPPMYTEVNARDRGKSKQCAPAKPHWLVFLEVFLVEGAISTLEGRF